MIVPISFSRREFDSEEFVGCFVVWYQVELFALLRGRIPSNHLAWYATVTEAELPDQFVNGKK